MDAVNELTIRHNAEATTIGQFRLTEHGLVFDGEVDRETWEQLGSTIKQLQKRIQWCIGDWLSYGEQKWGEMYDVAEKATGLEYRTLRQAKYVAQKTDLGRRRPNLTFKHHAEVVSLTQEAADAVLDRAEVEGLNCNQVRDLVREQKQGKEADFFVPELEGEAIRKWLVARQDAWPLEHRQTFARFVIRILERLERISSREQEAA